MGDINNIEFFKIVNRKHIKYLNDSENYIENILKNIDDCRRFFFFYKQISRISNDILLKRIFYKYPNESYNLNRLVDKEWFNKEEHYELFSIQFYNIYKKIDFEYFKRDYILNFNLSLSSKELRHFYSFLIRNKTYFWLLTNIPLYEDKKDILINITKEILNKFEDNIFIKNTNLIKNIKEIENKIITDSKNLTKKERYIKNMKQRNKKKIKKLKKKMIIIDNITEKFLLEKEIYLLKSQYINEYGKYLIEKEENVNDYLYLDRLRSSKYKNLDILRSSKYKTSKRFRKMQKVFNKFIN